LLSLKVSSKTPVADIRALLSKNDIVDVFKLKKGDSGSFSFATPIEEF
jgi:hypothetical protein